MGNIGAGETYQAWLVKKEYITEIDSLIKTTSTEENAFTEYAVPFRYRHLSANEMTFQPISAHLKGKFNRVIFTSENSLTFRERDKILLEDKTLLRITRTIPQVELGMFVISKNEPVILELS